MAASLSGESAVHGIPPINDMLTSSAGAWETVRDVMDVIN